MGLLYKNIGVQHLRLTLGTRLKADLMKIPANGEWDDELMTGRMEEEHVLCPAV